MYISRVISHFTDGGRRKKINRPISLSLYLSPLLSPLPNNDARMVAETRALRPLPCITPLFKHTPCNVAHPHQAPLSTNQHGRPRRRSQ